MPVHIVNRSPALVIVPLNSGGSIHLAPGETSREIADHEVTGNASAADLAERGLVGIDPVPPPKRAKRN